MKVNYIELAGKRHPLCCSLTATAALEDAFGDLTKMGESLMQGGIRAKMDAFNKVLTILMQAGRVYVHAEGGELPEPLTCAPSDLLDVTSGTAVRAIFSTISGDTKREVEAETKKDAAAPAEP